MRNGERSPWVNEMRNPDKKPDILTRSQPSASLCFCSYHGAEPFRLLNMKAITAAGERDSP